MFFCLDIVRMTLISNLPMSNDYFRTGYHTLISYNIYNNTSSSTTDTESGCHVFTILANHYAVQKITELYQQYTLKNFTFVSNFLTQDKYKELAIQLTELKINTTHVFYDSYENLRLNIIRSFEALLQGIYQNTQLSQYEEQNEKLREENKILHDSDLLKDYIDTLNSRMNNTLPAVEITAPLATIKPEYLEYINLYGLPEGFIFDADKLAEIVKRLNLDTVAVNITTDTTTTTTSTNETTTTTTTTETTTETTVEINTAEPNDYIPWENWDMIRMAYWNSLTK